MYDIIIIGSGPAGSTFAKLIDKKYKVLLINSLSIKSKPCGGLLSPDAQKCLAALNMTLPKRLLVDPQIFSVKVVDYDNYVTRNYIRSYLNFNRDEFNMWLFTMAKSRVETIDGMVVKINHTDEFYEVHIKSPNKSEEIIYKTTYLVGADGASGITRLSIYPSDRTEQLLSIQEWYESTNIKPIYSCIFDKKNITTYAWTISKDNYLIFGGVFKSNESFENVKKHITDKKPIKREACLINNVRKKSEILSGHDNAFLIGEASGLISPSSYEGISYAITSATILASVFNTNSNNFNKIYDKKLKPLKRKIGIKIWKAKILNNKTLRGLIMKSKISSVKVRDEKETNN